MTEPQPLDHDPWLTPKQVTEEYKFAKATLAEWRAKRINLTFRQVGRAVHYRKSVVEAFVNSRTIQVAS
jgi:hypothetical protein